MLPEHASAVCMLEYKKRNAQLLTLGERTFRFRTHIIYVGVAEDDA